MTGDPLMHVANQLTGDILLYQWWISWLATCYYTSGESADWRPINTRGKSADWRHIVIQVVNQLTGDPLIHVANQLTGDILLYKLWTSWPASSRTLTCYYTSGESADLHPPEPGHVIIQVVNQLTCILQNPDMLSHMDFGHFVSIKSWEL